MQTFYEKIDYAVKNWWLSLIVGILFVGIGILLMFTPVQSYIALSILFSVTMFVSGIFEIVFAASNRKTLSSWGWYLAGGIIDLILGIYLMLYPGMSMMILPFVLAFWLMFRGFSAIGYSIDLQRYGNRSWGWALVLGILAIICAFLFIWQPIAGAITVVYFVAWAFLFIGIFRIVFAFQLRKLHHTAVRDGKSIREEIREENRTHRD